MLHVKDTKGPILFFIYLSSNLCVLHGAQSQPGDQESNTQLTDWVSLEPHQKDQL